MRPRWLMLVALILLAVCGALASRFWQYTFDALKLDRSFDGNGSNSGPVWVDVNTKVDVQVDVKFYFGKIEEKE